MPYNIEELLNLPVDEKLDDDLLGNKLAQKDIEEELDRRIDEITKHPERVISWEEVKAKMKPRD